MSKFNLTPGFQPLDLQAHIFFLDTNVWSSILSSPNASEGFLPWLEKNDAVAALSVFTVFELSRAHHIVDELDLMIDSASSRIYIPLLYDELSDLEMSNYPDDVEMRWAPISNFRGEDGVRFLSTISQDPRFVEKRSEFIQFGLDRFMNLDQYKANFPLDDDGVFSEDHSELFAYTTTLDFLVRYFPQFLLPYKGELGSLDTSRIKSTYLRGLFLYFKYYVHGQSPRESDFMDFAHVSYLPYVDTYVTERNVLNVLNRVKSVRPDLVASDLIHVRDYVNVIGHPVQ